MRRMFRRRVKDEGVVKTVRNIEEPVPPMPEQMEIVLAEMAILRQEIAQIQAMITTGEENLRSVTTALLERMEKLSDSVRDLEKRLPPLPQ
jgi:predicted nuclease with TOPRIM domain